MSVGGLSLESLMAMAQAASSGAARRAQQAQQAQAQQAQQGQQTQQQNGVGGAQQAQQGQQQVQPSCDLDAANARNESAGEQWGEFKSDTPVEAAKAGADTQQQSDLYKPEVATPTTAQAAGAAAQDASTTATPAQAAATEQATQTPAATSTASPFKTNQDLINHCYKQGGGTWEGASKVARENGTSLNALVRDRNGTPPASTAPGGTQPGGTAPGSTAPGGEVPGSTAPRAQGQDRPIKGFREVDVNKLAEQLPAQAKHLAQSFVDSGRKHNVDPIALAAIAKHETGNFTSSAFRNKNNAMGVSDANGPIQQASHEASIDKMAKLMGSTTSGPYKGATTINEIGKIYAPIGAGNDPTGLNNHWSRGVAKFADDFEKKVGGGTSTAATSSNPQVATAQGTGGATATQQASSTGSTTTSGTTQAQGTSASGAAGGNGTASIERTRNAGARNQMIEGTITVNGNSYPFRSGGYGRGSLPEGTYTVQRHLDSRSDRSMSVGGVGYSFAVSDKFDPRVGDNRQLLRIHPDGGSAGTEGCIGIVGDAATQRRFRDDMLAEIRRNGGSYQLTVGR